MSEDMIPNKFEVELKKVPRKLFELGTYTLSHAIKLSCCSGRAQTFEEEMGILQAAHASEILIKSCIAEAAHPLLVFEDFPHSNNTEEDWLRFEELASDGRTIKLSKLPERLWATTGFEIHDTSGFDEFRKLRNSIQHFGVPPDCSATDETIEFIFPRIDELLDHFWGTCALEHLDGSDDERDKVLSVIKGKGVSWKEPTWL